MKKLSTLFVAIAIATVMTTAMNANAADTATGKQVVNINTATVTELAFLPGVGESKAKAIVKHRGTRPFKKVEDLMRVKGIGRKSFKEMRGYLTVQGTTTAKKKIKPTKR